MTERRKRTVDRASSWRKTGCLQAARATGLPENRYGSTLQTLHWTGRLYSVYFYVYGVCGKKKKTLNSTWLIISKRQRPILMFCFIYEYIIYYSRSSFNWWTTITRKQKYQVAIFLVWVVHSICYWYTYRLIIETIWVSENLNSSGTLWGQWFQYIYYIYIYIWYMHIIEEENNWCEITNQTTTYGIKNTVKLIMMNEKKVPM